MNSEALAQKVERLEKLVEAQARKIQLLEDIEAIKRLQKAYNYYVEHMMGQEIIDCFSDSPDVMLNWLEGKWLGKEGVRKYFAMATRTDGPTGFLHQLMPTGGLITVSPDGTTASGRWYGFGGIFMAKDGKIEGGSLTSGIYEMRYVKEEGTWKILAINWFIPYGAKIPGEWNTPEALGYRFIKGKGNAPQNEAGERRFEMPAPDIAPDPDDLRFVSGYILPHHFRHPVTGKETSENVRNSRLKPLQYE